MIMKFYLGGDIKESLLPALIQTLKDDEIQKINGNPVEDLSVEELHGHSGLPLALEFEMPIDMSTMAPCPDLNLDEFCVEHDLHYIKVLPPCSNSEGENANEETMYWSPGMDRPNSYMSSEEYPVIDQRNLFTYLDYMWAAKEKAESDPPLYINDENDYVRRYANEILAGKSFPEILKDYLMDILGTRPRNFPPFRIIKGQ